MRRNRLHNEMLPTDKQILSLPRGSSLEMTAKKDNVRIANVTWRDNKVVNLVSDYVGKDPMQTVKRYDKKSKKKISIDCPNIIKEYNGCMGGVDLLDSFIGRTKIKIRSKKWYMRIFYHLLDKKGIQKNRLLCLADFRVKLAVILCRLCSVSRPIGRPSTEMTKRLDRKRKHHSSCPLPPKESRLDNVDHGPIWFQNRLQCKVPGCKGYTFIKCSKCNVSLCLNKTRNCYRRFHQN